MKKIHCLVWIKKDDELARRFTRILEDWLREREIVPMLAVDAAACQNLPAKPDLIVSLGGDGTLLGLGRIIARSGAPIIGINLGHVGFLCAANLDNWQTVLEAAFNDKLPATSCLALRWRLSRESETLAHGIAINELAITHGFLARMVEMEIAVNGILLGVLRGDGLICYSPLGSSGYNLSAGGPLMPPTLANIGLTPICAYNSTFAPLILNDRAKLKATVRGKDMEACLTVDGQEGMPIKTDDVIYLEALPNALNLPGLETISKANLAWRV